MRCEIRTTNAPSPAGAYSQGLRTGNTVYTAGQVGKNPATGELPGEIEGQTRQTLENIKAILAEAGATMADVVKVTVHLQSFDDFDRFDAVYRTFFAAPLPVRTTVQSELGGFLIEVDAIAIAPDV